MEGKGYEGRGWFRLDFLIIDAKQLLDYVSLGRSIEDIKESIRQRLGVSNNHPVYGSRTSRLGFGTFRDLDRSYGFSNQLVKPRRHVQPEPQRRWGK